MRLLTRFVSAISLLLPSLQYGSAFTTRPLYRASHPSSTALSSSKRQREESVSITPKENGSLSRRQINELAFAATGLTVTAAGLSENKPTDYRWWGILPVGPYKTKKTIRETIVPNQIWTFDQKFGVLNVQVPLRMTVVKLNSCESLLVYNPIAATRECLELVHEIVEAHGPIRHIVLGSVALEHKAYAGVFAQYFKEASVWVQPGQYSVPVNLPALFLGFPRDRTFPMPATMDDAPAEWKADIDFQILGPIISRDGAFGETVVFHKATRTLLCTDTVVQVTDDVPSIYQNDPAPLLYHARDTVTDVVVDTPAARQKGWRRICLFGLYFMPSAITIKDASTALQERRPDINSDFAGIYPWDWTGDEAASWLALTGSGKKGNLLVAPILQVLLLNRSPIEVLDFADRVAHWPIQRIIPAHLKNNLSFTGKDYRNAFKFLEVGGVPNGYPRPLDADLELLRNAEVSLVASGAIAQAPSKPGTKGKSRSDILAETVYRCRSGVCAPQSKP
jgi:hypothetical protein